MKIAISSESSCDLPKEFTEKYDIHVMPYHIQFGDKTFCDGEMSTADLFAYADKCNTLPKTAAINEDEFETHFGELLKTHDAVVHVSLSSELTSATQNARAVAKRLGNIYVVDSRTLSTGVGLIAVYAAQLRDAGYSADKIAELCTERTKNVQVSSVIERLDYLYKGGRCNSLMYFGANLLKIRPRIMIKDGKIGPDKKYRGNIVRVLEKYCDELLKEFPNPDPEFMFVVYTTATPEMIEAAKKVCRDHGIKNIYEATAGGTVASHCGPHTLGLMYINDGGKVAK